MMRREQTSEKAHEPNGSYGSSGQKCQALSLGLALTGSILFAFSLGGCGAGFDIFPEKPSHAGAATGGAIGAGLGAVIGSQTGDAFGGAAIGALAGAGAGYAIGDAVSERDDRYAIQQQTIERQAAMLRAQQAEIDELRRLSGDGGPYGDRVSYGNRVPHQGSSYVSREGLDYSNSAPNNQIASTRRYIDPTTLKNPFASNGYSSSPNYATTTGYSRGYLDNNSMVAPSDTAQGSYSYRNSENSGTSYSRVGASSIVGSSLSASVPTHAAPTISSRSYVAAVPRSSDSTTLAPTRSTARTAPAAQLPNRMVVAEQSAPARQVSSSDTTVLSDSTVLSPALTKTTAPVTRITAADGKQKSAMRSSSLKGQDVRGALQPSAASEVADSRTLKQNDASMTSKGSASVGIALEVPEKKSEINEGSSEPTDIQRSSVAAGESGTAKMVDSSFNDCEKGEAEAKVAESSESLIDKLFYLRRAQRFCPNEPKWYVELGKIYTSLGRSEDAKTQYEDALQLRSDYAPAKEGLKDLEEAVY